MLDRPSLSPGPEAGVIVIFGLTADCDGPAAFAILRASRGIADCRGSAGALSRHRQEPEEADRPVP